MKKDLGKSIDMPSEVTAPGKSGTPDKYYPSTNVEGLDVPKSMLQKDIEVKTTVRFVRTEDTTDKTGTKLRTEMEFRKIDFGDKLDQDVQDDILAAIDDMSADSNDDENDDPEDDG